MKPMYKITRKDTKEIEEIKNQAEQFKTLDDFKEGSLLRQLSEAGIKIRGFHTCNFEEKKTFIANIIDIELDGINNDQWPRFNDVFISSAKIEGIEMTEKQLEILNKNKMLLDREIHKQLY